MSRMSLLCFAFATILGMITFGVKQKVAVIELSLKRLHRDIRLTQEALHVLGAEWTYLNNPVRLQSLAEKHLAMVPGASVHLVRLGENKSSSSGYDCEAMMQLASQLGGE